MIELDQSDPGKKYQHHPSKNKDVGFCEIPFGRDWTLGDMQLPENWKDIAIGRMHSILGRYRSVKLFSDICVRCGACSDKCQYFLATMDPKNTPVGRAELFRSVYRKYFTVTGKLFGRLVGAKELNDEMLREWYTYFYECSECRRCSYFCPYGIDTAEITSAAREVMTSIGIATKYTTEVIAKCRTIGNNLGVGPAAMANSIKFAEKEIKQETGADVKIPLNKRGAEVLFVTPSADFFGDPHWYTFKGYIKLFHQIGLDYTLSTYASEGGNFGLFVTYDNMKAMNRRIVDEARRLGVKWILGGECGHMWRVIHDFMDTMNGPLDFLEEPVSPITGTKFEKAKATKMVHVVEFTADLIKHNKLQLDASKNAEFTVTMSDSCNPARAMGLIEEPRFILKSVCPNYVEMDPNTNRERTFCCGAGAGILADEVMELRMKAGGPKAMAIKESGANFVALICAICKANYPHLMDYWKINARIGGVHELVGNALVL
jgi:Fe-S oxidoreductase